MRLTRRVRIVLLLKTLLDASSPGRGSSDVRSAFGSRAPARSGLWARGSYYELHRCLDALKSRGEDPEWRGVYGHTWRRYVNGEKFQTKTPWKADKGLAFLEEFMPADVFVPGDIVENAGYSPGEAKMCERPRREQQLMAA